MKFRAAFASAAVLLGTVGVAGAGPVLDAAQRSETLLAEGKHIEALAALDQALDAAWDASPLVFRKAMLVEESNGFARYKERPDNRVRVDERITVYSEPVGFAYRQTGDIFSADLAVDVTIENGTGQILVDAKDIFSVRTETRERQRQFLLAMSHVVPYIRPGDYVSTYTVRDKNSGKSGSFQIPITVLEAGPGPAAVPDSNSTPVAKTPGPADGSGATPPATAGTTGQGG